MQNTLIATTAAVFNEAGSSLYQETDYAVHGQLGGPIGQFIVYDATTSNDKKINWKKFFTKVVNVAKTVINAVASVINAESSVTVSNAALVC